MDSPLSIFLPISLAIRLNFSTIGTNSINCFCISILYFLINSSFSSLVFLVFFDSYSLYSFKIFSLLHITILYSNCFWMTTSFFCIYCFISSSLVSMTNKLVYSWLMVFIFYSRAFLAYYKAYLSILVYCNLFSNYLKCTIYYWIFYLSLRNFMA